MIIVPEKIDCTIQNSFSVKLKLSATKYIIYLSKVAYPHSWKSPPILFFTEEPPIKTLINE